MLERDVAPPEQVFAVPFGVDIAGLARLSDGDRTRARQMLGIAERDLVVISVCRFDRPRDFSTLLRAFARLARDRGDVRLLLVGDGPERRRIEARITEHGLRERVTFAGLQRDTTRYYAAADVFVSTSYGWEALGMATVEAQAAALPVIVTDAGGAAEAFVPGTTGLLIPPRDCEALADALAQLAGDGAQRRAMSAAGRTHVVTRFALEPMIDAIMDIYGPSCRARSIE